MEFDINKLQPLNGCVLVVDEEAPKERVVGSIILAESVQEADKMISGTVIEASCFMLQDGKYIEPEMKPKDKVMYSKYAGAGNSFEINKRTYRVLKHIEILAVIHK